MIVENRVAIHEGFADIVAGAFSELIVLQHGKPTKYNDGETNLALFLFLYPPSQVLRG